MRRCDQRGAHFVAAQAKVLKKHDPDLDNPLEFMVVTLASIYAGHHGDEFCPKCVGNAIRDEAMPVDRDNHLKTEVH